MKNRIVGLISLGIILSGALLSFGAFGALQDKKILLQKVFHHRGVAANSKVSCAGSIELGSLVLYFSNAPTINNLSPRKNNPEREELVFVVPSVQVVADDVKKMIKDLNSAAADLYSVRIEELGTPTNGIKISMSYNPKKVGMRYELFDSISLQKGVTFRFFNQELLKELNTKSCRPVLNTASAKKRHSVVIDCGHGGSDNGAVGCFNLKEKDIALAVGGQVADQLKKKGFRVIMTRDADFFVPLDRRTSLANSGQSAELFLSIHANASVNKSAQGIETFCCDPTLLHPVFSTMSDSYAALVSNYDVIRSARSKLCATMTHKTILAAARTHGTTVVDRKVKYEVSQVLLGTQMPAVLVELGFVSNEHDASLLNDKSYQQRLVQGICQGIASYFNASATA
ncbi:MAG: N-acetylmuramoyl-L-alanine amidase [Candidatus Dependentiae bacterium]|nr:N-acetylmuramoyl-L-alanine amidase [Candidatus Dependentiae bacterium]